MNKEKDHSHRRVADLHCDLLAYLALRTDRTPYDPDSLCSIPQMLAGGVAFQVLAIWTQTERYSSRSGLAQSRIFADIVERYPELNAWDGKPPAPKEGQVTVVAAIENASGFCDESEPLADGFRRFEEIEREVGRILYVGLTWGDENRFAGGDASTAGLKDDGRRLINFLATRSTPVAIDFSHASPQAAEEMMEHLEREGLNPPVLASHSCYASLLRIPRNLDDNIARQIFARGGVVGINFLRVFLGSDDEKGLIAQARHGCAMSPTQVVLGADYFAVNDVPEEIRQQLAPEGFYLPGYENASSYPRFFETLGAEVGGGGWPEGFLDDLAWENARRFLAQFEGD